MLLLFLLFGVLTLGPQVVLSDSFKFSFSDVQQCEPLSISFKGNLDPSDPVPVTLTILPFSGTAISIPIPSGAINSTGLNVTFLPLQEDATFIASLDDSTGDNAAQVSDIIKVAPSGNSSCQMQQQNSVPSFTVQDSVSQCESFTVRYKNNTPPTVRLFFPRGGSTLLNMTSNNLQNRSATYTMVAPRQSEVILLLNDTVVTQTSALLSVQGDTSSSTACFPRNNKSNNAQQPKAPKSGVSNSVAIGLGVGFGILFLLAIPMIWYVIRERRRNRQAARNNTFDPTYIEKRSFDPDEKRGSSPEPNPTTHTLPSLPSRPPAPPPFFSYNTSFNKERYPYDGDGYVKDPAYVSEAYSPTISDYPRSSISWEMVTPGDRNSGTRRQSSSSRRSQRDTKTILPSSRDLEHMLDVAGNELNESDDSKEATAASRRNSNNRSSRDSRSGASRPSWMSLSGKVTMPSSIPTRSRDRTGSQTGSMTFSVSSLNPIQDVPQNAPFLTETTMDSSGDPIFYESPRSMESYLSPYDSPRTSLPQENPGRLASRFSAFTSSSDGSVGQIIRAQPPSATTNSSMGAEDGHGVNSGSKFPPPSAYKGPSPLARAVGRNSSVSMESWGNIDR